MNFRTLEGTILSLVVSLSPRIESFIGLLVVNSDNGLSKKSSKLLLFGFMDEYNRFFSLLSCLSILVILIFEREQTEYAEI